MTEETTIKAADGSALRTAISSWESENPGRIVIDVTKSTHNGELIATLNHHGR